ncbi:DUF4160 domain-containing protein [Methylobacterium sp. J-068]|uniref:DUF4160 domain-containing protein n=1 Tax=Methylobacterium sp. J-068 TaxID=2836649 RepID=UPI001FBB6DDD|nr:DUF4160 domain-containing protein [Methylobacterium sp. J-068]MCJ2036408.1 DUF4160 domain-containing protein [Methylobacterium sp. J-068]
MPTFQNFDSFRLEVRSRDHNPPHFHIVGPDHHALVNIQTLQVMEGTLTRKMLAEAVTWAAENTDALMNEWRRLNERD